MPAEEHIRTKPKITFGLIVLNGEPFTRYLLRAIYPFAHEIIVVEGAAPAARAIATPEGHSNDGTLEVLHDFQRNEDPERRLTVVTAEDCGYHDGFWPGEKDEQSQAYAKRATGEYLWQVDVDEFYHPADMGNVLRLLETDPAITAISFPQLTFWGGFDYTADSWFLRRYLKDWHRVFKWGPKFRYVTHRPPTVLDGEGRNLRDIRWLDSDAMAREGIFIHHYSLVFPRQVEEKCNYYGHAPWAQRNEAEQWAQQVFLGLRRPYQVHNVYEYPSWLERFEGTHPPQIQAMQRDIHSHVLAISLRTTQDIERLLNSRAYQVGRALLRWLTPAAALLTFYRLWLARWQSFRRNPSRAVRRMLRRIRGGKLTEPGAP